MNTYPNDFPLTIAQISALSEHSKEMVLNGNLRFMRKAIDEEYAQELADMALDSSNLRKAALSRARLID